MKKASGIMLAIMVVAAILIGILITAKYSTADLSTQEIKIGAGGFSIETPVVLKELPVQAIDASSFKVDVHLFKGENGNKSYFVSYYDLPPDYVGKVGTDEIFNQRLKGMMGSLRGKLLNEKIISFDGNSGREIEVSADTQDGVYLLISHLFLVGNRIYHIMITSPKNVAESSDIKCLNSFKLLK
ncbi:MAG: hypothetical protein ABSB79_09310 [Syntrophales bacterium]|jgi:hypothetical protein